MLRARDLWCNIQKLKNKPARWSSKHCNWCWSLIFKMSSCSRYSLSGRCACVCRVSHARWLCSLESDFLSLCVWCVLGRYWESKTWSNPLKQPQNVHVCKCVCDVWHTLNSLWLSSASVIVFLYIINKLFLLFRSC